MKKTLILAAAIIGLTACSPQPTCDGGKAASDAINGKFQPGKTNLSPDCPSVTGIKSWCGGAK